MVCSGSWRESEKEERREGRGQSPSTKLPALKVVKKCLAQETHHESYRPVHPVHIILLQLLQYQPQGKSSL